MMHGNKHAYYVDFRLLYNTVRYLQDFKEDFPVLFHVVFSQFYPHITTDLDFESLFSQAGFVSEPRRARTGIRIHKCLVFGKHLLKLIHCSIPIVNNIFMKRWKDNSWEE